LNSHKEGFIVKAKSEFLFFSIITPENHSIDRLFSNSLSATGKLKLITKLSFGRNLLVGRFKDNLGVVKEVSYSFSN
jgi:hypothetical protein